MGQDFHALIYWRVRRKAVEIVKVSVAPLAEEADILSGQRVPQRK